jgi:uncharacterized protein (DUF58 family)
MPSRRGYVVFAAGIGLWIAARLVGSPDLHIVAVGVALLPLAAGAFARWSRARLGVRRRLSATKVAPGQRVRVELEVENRSPATTSFILLEDQVPSALGRPARLVLTGLPARNSQRVAYTVLCRTRGRYHLGPLRIDISDPFALTKLRLEYAERDELVVFPEVEELRAVISSQFGSGAGESTSRHLFRTGEEFFTMREYQVGDDLRRIHWPSVARRGRLMIRQDESARRSLATVFVDTRVSSLGQAHTPAFERGVSAAASIGAHLSRGGYGLRLAAGTSRPVPVSEEGFLEALAQVVHTPSRPLGSMLLQLRTSAVADSTLAVVTAPLPPAEIAAMTRLGTVFGPKVAVLVYPVDPESLPPERRDVLEGQATTAQLSLARAGWDVFLLRPSGRLQDLWHANRKRLPAAIGSLR